ncbi:putative ribonuclease H-like domain-containing protein [Tanacetum coccineum]
MEMTTSQLQGKLWLYDEVLNSSEAKNEELERLKIQEKEANDAAEALRKEFAQDTKDLLLHVGAARATSTNTVNTTSTPVSTNSPLNVFSTVGPTINITDLDDSQIPALEDIYDNLSDGIFTNASYDDEGAVADFTNLESTVNVSPIPTSRIHSSHPTTQILSDPKLVVQTRSKVHKSSRAHAFVSYIQKQRRNNHKDFQHCLFACFLSQIEPKKISEALEDESWVDAMQEELLQFKIQKMSSMGELTFFLGLQVKQKEDGIFISQDKYVAEILKKFNFAGVKTANTSIKTHKSLTKDEEAADVDVHLYRSMIGSLMYLTASRPDIMYLKGKPKLGLWYHRVSSFDLEAYSDSDYARENLDRKSTIRGCQFLGRRLISWQCKKQTIVATSTTEVEYVATANCCGQNPCFHSKTKAIDRHHFIRDAYEKTLIQVLKIHTDDNVADLLTKAFDFVDELLVKRWVVDDMMNFKVDMLHEDRVNTVELAIPGQMVTGKESSNSFMVGSFPKTIHLCDSLQSDEDSFELIELMILCTNFLTMVCDLENLKNHSSDNEESLGEDASKQGSIHDAYAIVTKEQKVDDDKETTQEVVRG